MCSRRSISRCGSPETTVRPAGVSETFEYAGTTQFERTKTTGSNYSYSFTNDILGVGSLIGNGLTNYYVRDNAQTVLGQSTTAGRHYYLFDGLGSIVALTDSSGNVVRTFKYDPFGNVTSETGTVDAKWRFAGQYWDGQGFYKMGVRWYDPKLGRWTQRDPLDQPLEPRGWNAYVYVGNDPINFIDPTGMYRGESYVRRARRFVSRHRRCIVASVGLAASGIGLAAALATGPGAVTLVVGVAAGYGYGYSLGAFADDCVRRR